MKSEIRICGFGGQGIILAGVVLGEAAVKAGHKAVQTQSYGPEARGGAARSEVVISSEAIDYPRVVDADVVVVLSQPAYDKYVDGQDETGTIIVDSDLVKTNGDRGEKTSSMPFVATAERVGHKIVTNIVMLGYLAAFLDIFPHEVLEETVLANVPAGTEEMNRKAVQAGRDLFLKANEQA